MLKIAFDLGGVITKYPQQFRKLCRCLHDCCELHLITDMHDKELVVRQLRENGFPAEWLPDHRVHVSDYAKYGEMCKAVLLRDLEIELFIDDFVGYHAWDSQLGSSPIRLLIQPDAFRPYWAEDWKVDPKMGDFGRRVAPKELASEKTIGAEVNCD